MIHKSRLTQSRRGIAGPATEPGRTERDIRVTDFKVTETLELQECQRVLECALRQLDQVGAGIAAIHVNAAIEQLKTNIAQVKGSAENNLEPMLNYASDSPRIVH